LIVKTAVITFIVTVTALTALRAWTQDQIFGGGATVEIRTVTTP
jgi:hypothetical protein